MEAAPSYGATSRAHCLRCEDQRTFTWSGSQNHSIPRVDLWRCMRCGYERMQMADVTDAENLCRTVLKGHTTHRGLTLPPGEYAEAVSLLQMELCDLWLRWDPTRGIRFRAYAIGLLRLRVNNHWRDELGRDIPKAHSGALSLDAPVEDGSELGAFVAASTGDLGMDRAAGLNRALAQGGRGTSQPLPPRSAEPAASGGRE